MNTITLDEIIGTGLFLIEEARQYGFIANKLNLYISLHYEEYDGEISNKEMERILYSSFRDILLFDTGFINRQDKEIILDAILLYHDNIIG